MSTQEIKQSILSTLAYFDLFHHPLTQREIFLFSSIAYEQNLLSGQLKELTDKKYIYKYRGVYSLTNNPGLEERRKRGHDKALLVLKTAKKVASLLALLPYIRGIAVSGSLSKYYADEQSDIDFFIITAGNRLWLARSFTHLLKKISFLFKKQQLFCMNYYIDEEHPEIVEKNIFTATEIVTLLPIKGVAAFEAFYKSNKWVESFLPNHFMHIAHATEIRHTYLKRPVEWMLNNKIGDRMEKRLMCITTKRWSKKTARNQLNDHGITMSMAASRYYAKPDPAYFQEKLLNNYLEKLNSLPVLFPESNDVIISH